MHPLVLTLEKDLTKEFSLGSFTYSDGDDDYGIECELDVIVECATTCPYTFDYDFPENFILEMTATTVATYDLRFRLFYYSDLADLSKGFT